MNSVKLKYQTISNSSNVFEQQMIMLYVHHRSSGGFIVHCCSCGTLGDRAVTVEHCWSPWQRERSCSRAVQILKASALKLIQGIYIPLEKVTHLALCGWDGAILPLQKTESRQAILMTTIYYLLIFVLRSAMSSSDSQTPWGI